MEPAHRAQRSGVGPLVAPPHAAGARRARPPRPRPGAHPVDAGAPLERRCGCHGPPRHHRAPPPETPHPPGRRRTGWPRLEARAARAAQASAVRPRLPVRARAPPGRGAAYAPWRGCRLPRPAWPPPVASAWRTSGVAPLGTPPRSRGRPRPVYPISRAAPVCRAPQPSAALAPAAAGPPPSHWTGGPRHTRPVCTPVRARPRAFRGLSPVGVHRGAGSRHPPRHTRPLAETHRAGARPASVGRAGWSARSPRPTSASGTSRLTPSGSARPPSDGRSADAPAHTPPPSPRPTRAWPGLFRLPD